MENKKRKNDEAEYGVDSRYPSRKERELEATALMEARLMRMKNVSKEQIIRARLLQLKLKMEEYIKKPTNDPHPYFTEFLKTYIDTIYPKRSLFAKDMNIEPVSLSQVINHHREPKEEFMLRLMIHSEKAYKNVGEFDKSMWFQVYYHEKIGKTLFQQEQWRPQVEKHVKFSESI